MTNLKQFKDKMMQRTKFKQEYERMPKHFEEGSYFSFIRSDGKDKYGNECSQMSPCHAEIIEDLGGGYYKVVRRNTQ